MAVTTITVITAGRMRGKITRKKRVIGEAPSTIAASSISRGIDRDERPKDDYGEWHNEGKLDQDQSGSVLNNPIACSTKIVGTTAGGMISPASINALTNNPRRSLRRCCTKATIEHTKTIRATEPIVRTRLFLIDVTTMPSRAVKTAPRLSQRCHSVGQVKSR